MKLKPVVEQLLRSGLDDWVDASEVAWIAQEAGGAVTKAEILGLSLEAVSEVLDRGWMRIGILTHDGFREWPISRSDALERVRREWDALSAKTPDLGEIFWLANTEEGDRVAEKLDERDESKTETGSAEND